MRYNKLQEQNFIKLAPSPIISTFLKYWIAFPITFYKISLNSKLLTVWINTLMLMNFFCRARSNFSCFNWNYGFSNCTQCDYPGLIFIESPIYYIEEGKLKINYFKRWSYWGNGLILPPPKFNYKFYKRVKC